MTGLSDQEEIILQLKKLNFQRCKLIIKQQRGNQMTYNGWTNRSTWALHLNLCNEEITRERYAECKCVQDILDLWNDYFSLDHDRVILGEVNFSELIERLEFERAL